MQENKKVGSREEKEGTGRERKVVVNVEESQRKFGMKGGSTSEWDNAEAKYRFSSKTSKTHFDQTLVLTFSILNFNSDFVQRP